MTMAKQAILMFHGIGEPPTNIPPAEVPYWITDSFFDEIVGYARSRHSGPEIVFTFDDGNESDVAAARKLSEVGLKGQFFVLAGRLESPGYLDRSGLLILDDLGMEIGLHGTHHVDWRRASQAELIDETVTSRKTLADVVGKPITSLAIPFGAYNKRVLRYLESQNFDRIYLADNGLATAGSKYLRRNPVMGWQTISHIDDYVEDRASLLTKVRRKLMPLLKRQLA